MLKYIFFTIAFLALFGYDDKKCFLYGNIPFLKKAFYDKIFITVDSIVKRLINIKIYWSFFMYCDIIIKEKFIY